MLRRRYQKFAARTLEKYKGIEIKMISHGANFLGVESQGPGQVRGNGILFFTADMLIFEQWVPNRVIKIPLEKIFHVGETKKHLGKMKPTPLLKVRFTNETGMDDSGAWWIQDLEHWVFSLSSISGKKDF